MDLKEKSDIGVHIGTEILVRTSGPFKEGYIYGSIDKEHPLLIEANEEAIKLIINKKRAREIFNF
jgi:hypothetical protein